MALIDTLLPQSWQHDCWAAWRWLLWRMA